MSQQQGLKVFVTGTDTDIGKTVVCAGLCLSWPAHYWKPIQAGYAPEPSLANTTSANATLASVTSASATPANATPANKSPLLNHHQTLKVSTKPNNLKPFLLPQTDSAFISQFIPSKNIHPPAYTLKQALSPNQAGRKENIFVQNNKIKIPPTKANLVIEGAGGALVPLNDKENMVDLMQKCHCPIIIVAQSGLGTLNHTFLTLGHLRAKKLPILGVIMVGPRHKDNKRDIEQIGKVPVLLELPWLKKITAPSLMPYFKNMPQILNNC